MTDSGSPHRYSPRVRWGLKTVLQRTLHSAGTIR
jgi:hypothetical protein